MKKIMFNDKYDLTAAVLNGRKTMTRRVIPEVIAKHFEKQYGEVDVIFSEKMQQFTFFRCSAGTKPEDHLLVACRFLEPLKAAPYKIGEEIAVAQSYESMANGGYLDRMTVTADNAVGFEFKLEYCGGGYKNKMFVAADLMPHHIRISDIKVERLQDISDEDCIKEGILKIKDPYIKEETDYYFKGCDCLYTYPKTAFAALIDKVSGKGTWESNPWVFAYSFKLID